MPMQDPAHPGLLILYECIEPLGLTIEEAADAMAVEVGELSDIVTCRTGLTTEMAIRVSKVFGGSARSWYQMQAAYDIAVADRYAGSIEVGRVLWPNLPQITETTPASSTHKQSGDDYARSTDPLSVPVGDIVHLHAGMMAAAQVFARQIHALESIGTNVVAGVNGPSTEDWSAFIGVLPVVRDLGRLLRTVSKDLSMDAQAYGFEYDGNIGNVAISPTQVIRLQRGFEAAGLVVNSLFDEMEKRQVGDAIGEESFVDLDHLARAEYITEAWAAFVRAHADIALAADPGSQQDSEPQVSLSPHATPSELDGLFEAIRQFLQAGPIPEIIDLSPR